MKDQINTIREALEKMAETRWPATLQTALTALDQIEKMAGEQEPVKYEFQGSDGKWYPFIDPRHYDNTVASGEWPIRALYTAAPASQQYEAGDVASAAAQGFRDGVASVAQQPPKLEDIEQYRMQMAGISTAAMGYWKEGDSIHPDYDTPALRDVAKLYAKYDALYKAQQPQAEPDNHEARGQIEFLDKKNNALLAAIRKVMARLADLLDEDQFKEIEETISSAGVQPQAEAVPVDMVLYCPKCGVQHIDEPEDCPDSPGRCECRGPHWKNPPHKSHLCHGCGHIWRPSDMPTNGVKATASGKDADTAPQRAEAVQACGHPVSLLLRSAETGELLYCEACDDKSGRHDAERRETELLDANRRLQEKIGSADALKLHAIEELCQLGYTVKDGELIPPDHLHKLVEAAGHPLCGKQAEAVPSGWKLALDEEMRQRADKLASALRGSRVNYDVEQAAATLIWEMRDALVAAPQQAEAVPIPDHELVTMYDERPTSDLEMIEFAREVERRHGIGVQPQHITDGSPCWCNPDVAYTDPETGASVIVHRRPQ